MSSAALGSRARPRPVPRRLARAPVPIVRSDRGQAGGVEVLPFGLLVFVALTLVLVNLWAVIDARMAAGTAAREATRFVVEQAGLDVGDDLVASGAETVADDALAGLGRTATAISISAPDGLVRCARVRVQVDVRVPAVTVPFTGLGAGSYRVTAAHSELVDPTRSGVDGSATCGR